MVKRKLNFFGPKTRHFTRKQSQAELKVHEEGAEGGEHSEGTVPCKMKIARVVLLFKKDFPKEIVTTDPFLSHEFYKILEKLVHKRLYDYVLVKNFLSPIILASNQAETQPKHCSSIAACNLKLLAAYLSCDASSLCMLGAPLSSFVQDQWKRSVSNGEAALASAVAELRDVVRGHLSSILSIAEARRLLLEVCLSEV
ncbi:hypothetical protein CAPTEDRAFT_189814 [Capitella teleta]|uniref:Uncharacterized protein n=1 Tax=Capitella teleta TaxID=283909 RepID=R7UEN4_CAPTE|nr:hypothetical protein CAPTEDRAFT_189814 [Capitella teleta]|eukprot:ELU04546.1 hypothetical protein CAPTEDRAFT_189814 [Capitella teleta]